MDKYADNIHIMALSKALNVNVQVIHLDNSEASNCIVHTFPIDNAPPCIHLLFRSAHYDILYSNIKET